MVINPALLFKSDISVGMSDFDAMLSVPVICSQVIATLGEITNFSPSKTKLSLPRENVPSFLNSVMVSLPLEILNPSLSRIIELSSLLIATFLDKIKLPTIVSALIP